MNLVALVFDIIIAGIKKAMNVQREYIAKFIVRLIIFWISNPPKMRLKKVNNVKNPDIIRKGKTDISAGPFKFERCNEMIYNIINNVNNPYREYFIAESWSINGYINPVLPTEYRIPISKPKELPEIIFDKTLIREFPVIVRNTSQKPQMQINKNNSFNEIKYFLIFNKYSPI